MADRKKEKSLSPHPTLPPPTRVQFGSLNTQTPCLEQPFSWRLKSNEHQVEPVSDLVILLLHLPIIICQCLDWPLGFVLYLRQSSTAASLEAVLAECQCSRPYNALPYDIVSLTLCVLSKQEYPGFGWIYFKVNPLITFLLYSVFFSEFYL